MENPPKKFFRLSPGTEVRLRYAYFITCREVVKNAAGEVVELRCSYDPATRGGNAPDGRKVQATIHWVSAADAVPAEVRLYNPLFTRPDPNAGDFAADLNPQVAGGAHRRARRARARRRQRPRGGAVRAPGLLLPDDIRRPTGSCSTARSACAIPGPRCRAGKVYAAGLKRSPIISDFWVIPTQMLAMKALARRMVAAAFAASKISRSALRRAR